MKSLKSLIFTVSLLIGGITVTGCGGKTASDSSQHTDVASMEQSANDNDSVANKDNDKSGTEKANETEADNKISKSEITDTATIKQLQSALNDSIGSVNKRLTAIDIQSKRIESSLKRQETIFQLSIVVALLVAIVSLIVAIRALSKIKVANRRINKSAKAFKDFMEEIAQLKEKFSDATSYKSSSAIGKSDHQALSSRISALEYRLQQYASAHSSSQSTQVANDKKQSSNKEGYFGLPSKMTETSGYFKKLLEYCDSYTRFSVKVINGDKAEFSICDNTLSYLKTLTSSDTAKLAIEFTGCPVEEARTMQQIKSGEAVLSGDRWIITKKATINLSSN